MISGRREFVVFVSLLLIIGNDRLCRGQSDEDSSSDYTDNEIDLVKTYRSGIEKVLQGLLSVVSGGSSSESRSSESSSSSSDGGAIGDFISSLIPKPIKNVLAPVENATARGFGDVLDLFEDKFHAIFPGTLWCGSGNIAKNEKDVGLFKKTDACCRDHDNCPSNINAGKTLGRLLNNGIFTRSACSCDHQFYNCLKNVSSVVSANIGATYFNILRPQCFEEEYPIESCEQYGSNRIVNRKCVKYKLDDSQNKTLEWFDNSDF